MDDSIAELVKLDGWHAEGAAARVHYEGAGDRFAVEYYAGTDAVLYWSVPDDDGSSTASPVARASVPNPLRKRIRRDLAAADVDPEVERREI
ncbi:DUF7538 family protein [Halorubrum sp. DTA98]|uniref:DUF7538 family protein n=1 Tax=Halorubrum sp. DTA98 TaxID=3402163 RepID=UPI003AAFFC1A